MSNHLYYGDNLTVLRDSIDCESVDLVYLDPPFNSNAMPARTRRSGRASSTNSDPSDCLMGFHPFDESA